MKYLFKENGKLSLTNVSALIVVLVSLFEIWKPFIPAEYLPVALAVFGSVVIVLRTFQTDGSPIIK